MIDITLNTSSQPMQLHMAGELTIVSAEQARLALLEALAELPALQQAPLTIDASGITAADTAGVQLMLATARHLSTSAHSAVLRGCPNALQRVAEALGAADDTQCCGLQLEAAAGAQA